ncbi:MAG: hypothetical protein MUD02_05435, partial [Bacteroidales bacterium]|nr:hypothetical protein [Bacteroidales bacterium]
NAVRHEVSLSGADLLKHASSLLAENGRIQVIMPWVEGNVFIAEAAAYGLYCGRIIKIKPLPTSEVKRIIITLSRNKTKLSESFLTIEHGPRHDFTEEYKMMTRDFYIKF